MRRKELLRGKREHSAKDTAIYVTASEGGRRRRKRGMQLTVSKIITQRGVAGASPAGRFNFHCRCDLFKMDI